ncbi:transketolase subunit A [Ruminococcaceae bacterium KH2T8]|nr:transketolase subunit A [Ruminococcaceae bacterium KH2T8]
MIDSSRTIDVSASNAQRLTEMSLRIRLDAMDMALASGNNGSHLGGSLSCVEIMSVLYGEVLRFDVENPLNPSRDRFIPSKNHCVLAHIPALAEAGFIPHEEIMEFQKDGGRLTGYPQRQEIGLEYSGGSLGMAISVGVGLALSSREKKLGNQIYILMGDGELNEGSIWEAIMSASHYHLDNLVAIIDRNHLSYDGDTEEVMALNDLAGKFRSFNWHVSECNGHDTQSLLNAFADNETGKPHVIIADTVKGKGISFIENKPEWHHHRLSQAEYDVARAELLGERS